MFLERPTRRRSTTVRWECDLDEATETMNTNIGVLHVYRNRARIELVRKDDPSKERFVISMNRSELRYLLGLMEGQK